MKPNSQALLDFLHSIREYRKDLLELLCSIDDRPFVYFIAPLSNVMNIFSSKGIYPRNYVTSHVDLSAHQVQHYRKEIYFEELKKKIPLHDCNNLFLNSFNDTYYLFRRHALIRAQAADPWAQFVCILEIDLSLLLQSDDIYWKVTDKNFAKYDPKISSTGSIYKQFPWETIYSIEYNGLPKDTNNPIRSSELITYSENREKNYIPTSCINRILLAEKDSQYDTAGVLSTTPLEIIKFAENPSKKIKVLDNPLNYDKRLVESLSKLGYFGVGQNAIIYALQRIARIEDEIGLTLYENFDKASMALNKHGMDHICRVMIWILLIAEAHKNNQIEITSEEIKSALYAGFFHDLCRMDNTEEPTHGSRAAQKYGDFISKVLPPMIADRCINAITVHSKCNEPDDEDIVWQLLKDADALDRGRFGPPNSETGCKQSKLRSPLFKNGKYDTIEFLWSAYWLAKCTSYVNWDLTTTDNRFSTSFISEVLVSLNKAITFHVNLPNPTKTMAKEICLGVVRVK